MTTFQLPRPTVSVEWLAAHLDNPELVLLDATMQTAVAAGSGAPVERHLRGARRFDFDTRVCDRTSALPHMMPTPELFTQEVRALGIGRDSRVVIYDRVGVYSSPRAWWMFRAMGHDQVAVLDGGLPAWVAAGMPCEGGPCPPAEGRGDFVARPRPGLFCDAERVTTALADETCAVLDARSAGRFQGREPEPRAGLRPGHMPNALNLPFGSVQTGGRMRSKEELIAIFAEKLGAQQTWIFSCGSGVTACILALAAELAGHTDMTVYDGSWSEWGLPSARAVVTG
jgi:thiosulfate/3-mercaptopyruvate sulfurtransferase